LKHDTFIRAISHADPELQLFKEKISQYVEQAEAQQMKYWVLLKDSKPVYVVILGKEPVRLIAPIDTPLSIVKVIDPQASKETLYAAAIKAIELSEENGAEYSYLWLPLRYMKAVLEFIEAGYQELGDTYEMEFLLDSFFVSSTGLRFERVKRGDLNLFLQHMKEHMSGSPDAVLRMILDNIREMPNEFLDMWYKIKQLFWVYNGENVVGMLDLNVKECMISNIGVAPEERNKGYGRQIMVYGLNVLKNNGCGCASLRVHVENEAAIHLYKKLGFTETDRLKNLIWWKNRFTST
jgi:ribosomal protein S18 acetylase RimI-like enzyme